MHSVALSQDPSASPISGSFVFPSPPSFRIGADAGVLSAVHEPEVNVAIWERSVPVAVVAQLREWAKTSKTEFDEQLDTKSFALGRAIAGLTDEKTRSWLVADVAETLGAFASVAGTTRMRVSFGAVNTDKCRKFHVDFVGLRLVLTYAGPGTEWLPNSAVDRAALAHPLDCPCDANKKIVRSEGEIRRAKAGDVVILKGGKFHGDPTRAAVHRSPPVEASGETRVVLIATAL